MICEFPYISSFINLPLAPNFSFGFYHICISLSIDPDTHTHTRTHAHAHTHTHTHSAFGPVSPHATVLSLSLISVSVSPFSALPFPTHSPTAQLPPPLFCLPTRLPVSLLLNTRRNPTAYLTSPLLATASLKCVCSSIHLDVFFLASFCLLFCRLLFTLLNVFS